MRRRTAVVALTLSLALAASGCGGGKKDDDSLPAKKASASQDATTTTAPATAAAGAGASAGAPKSGAAVTATSTTLPPGKVVSMPADFTVTVDKPCVHPKDTVNFTVRGGVPNQLLIYDTAYYDEVNQRGTSNYTNNYGSGEGNAKFDGSGTYRGTYVLAPNVPAPSTAYLSVGTSRGRGTLIQARANYLIKPVGQSCG